MTASNQRACAPSGRSRPTHSGEFDWTDARKLRLTALWADPDLSAEDIRKTLGAPSRSSILGKAKRMGLPAKTAKPRKEERKRSRADRPENRGRQQPQSHPWHGDTNRKPPTPARSFDPPAEQPPAAGAPKLLRDLGPRQCRWPLPGQPDRVGWMEETLFCAEAVAPKRLRPEEDSPYCRCHRDAASNPKGTAKAQASAAAKRFLHTRRNPQVIFGHTGGRNLV